MTTFIKNSPMNKFAVAVCRAILDGGAKFYIYRTIEGKVIKCSVSSMAFRPDIDSQIHVSYKYGELFSEVHVQEVATDTDLKLISDQAKTASKKLASK